MKNKKLLSLVLAISFAMPVQANDGWRYYFSWLFISSFWDNFKDGTSTLFFGGRTQKQFWPEAISGGVMHGIVQLVATGIFSGGSFVLNSSLINLQKLWHWRKHDLQVNNSSMQGIQKFHIPTDEFEKGLTPELKQLRSRILGNDNDIGHRFLEGLNGNGKSEFEETIIRESSNNPKAAIAVPFPMAEFKLLLGKNPSAFEAIFKQVIINFAHHNPNKNKIVCFDELGKETQEFKDQFYIAMDTLMPELEDTGVSFLAAGNFPLSASLASRFTTITIVPSPSFKKGINVYKKRFDRQYGPGYSHSSNFSLTPDFIKTEFGTQITYLAPYEWLDEEGLEKNGWHDVQGVRKLFGKDKSLVSFRDWKHLASLVKDEADARKAKVVSKAIFVAAMQKQIEKSRLAVTTLMQESNRIPSNIQTILRNIETKRREAMQPSMVFLSSPTPRATASTGVIYINTDIWADDSLLSSMNNNNNNNVLVPSSSRKHKIEEMDDK